jgi:hypothetical protein
MVLISGLGLVCMVAPLPRVAYAKTRPPVELGDPDADEGGNPGPGSDGSIPRSSEKWSISIAAGSRATWETRFAATKLPYGYLVGLWLRLRFL